MAFESSNGSNDPVMTDKERISQQIKDAEARLVALLKEKTDLEAMIQGLKEESSYISLEDEGKFQQAPQTERPHDT